MKKIISLALAMVFVLIATLSVSAASIPSANQVNNVTDGKWIAGNGKACFGYDTAIAEDIYMVADGVGKVFNWWAVYKDRVAADVISADFSPKANVGLFFGATDPIRDITVTTNLNGSTTGNMHPDNCKNLQYYFANICYNVASDSYTFYLLNDANQFGKSQPDASNITKVLEVALDKTTYGINGTDDINLKVDFTATGDVKVYVNGIKVADETGLVPYGDNIGIMAPTTDYGTEKANNGLVFTVNNFTIGEPVTPPAGGNGGEQAPENGDATALYVVLSAVALCATFAVALSHKKRIEE